MLCYRGKINFRVFPGKNKTKFNKTCIQMDIIMCTYVSTLGDVNSTNYKQKWRLLKLLECGQQGRFNRDAKSTQLSDSESHVGLVGLLKLAGCHFY